MIKKPRIELAYFTENLYNITLYRKKAFMMDRVLGLFVLGVIIGYVRSSSKLAEELVRQAGRLRKKV